MNYLHSCSTMSKPFDFVLKRVEQGNDKTQLYQYFYSYTRLAEFYLESEYKIGDEIYIDKLYSESDIYDFDGGLCRIVGFSLDEVGIVYVTVWEDPINSTFYDILPENKNAKNVTMTLANNQDTLKQTFGTSRGKLVNLDYWKTIQKEDVASFYTQAKEELIKVNKWDDSLSFPLFI